MVTSVRDASKRLGVRYATLRLWIASAQLPMGRVGTVCLVNFDDVAQLVAAKRQRRAG